MQINSKPNNDFDVKIIEANTSLKRSRMPLILTLCCFFVVTGTALILWFLVANQKENPLLSSLNERQDFIALSNQVYLTLRQPTDTHYKQLQSHFDKKNTLTNTARINQEHDAFRKLIQAILAQKNIMVKIPTLQKNLTVDLNSFTMLLSNFSERLTENGAYSGETIRQIDALVAQAQKINTQVAYLADVNYPNDVFAVATLATILTEIESGFNRLLEGDPATGIQSLRGSADEETIFEAQTIYSNIATGLAELLEVAPELVESKKNITQIETLNKSIMDALDTEIASQLITQTKDNNKTFYASVFLAIILLLSLITLFIVWTSFKRKTITLKYEAYTEKERNQRHEHALIRMINELESLSEGDLATELTITDDSTGIVCDCINITIEGLRNIVMVIRQEATKIDLEIQQAQKSHMTQLHLMKEIKSQLNQASNQLNTLYTLATHTQKLHSTALQDILNTLQESMTTATTYFNRLQTHAQQLSIQANQLESHKTTLIHSINQFKLPTDDPLLVNLNLKLENIQEHHN